jgi:hypothetical protein
MHAFKHGQLHTELGVMLRKLITKKIGEIGLTHCLPP